MDQLLDSGDEKKTTKADDALEALKKKALDALEAEKTGIDRELDLWLRENLDISLEDLNAAGIKVCWSCYKNNAVRFVKRGYRADPVQSPGDLGGWFEQIQKEENERDMKGKGLRNRYEAEKSSRIGNWLRAFFKRG